MVLDESIRERAILIGGKLAGVECPNCEFDGRDLDMESHTTEAVSCPNCGTTLLTADEKAQLRQAHKL